MNYANMIEEKNLKKTFIIATLCSTIIGTFSSSIGLWDRVKERRKQQKRDFKQDSEIKELRDKIEAANQRSNENQQRLIQPPPPSPSRSQRQRSRGGDRDRDRDRDRWDDRDRDRDRDEVGDAFERSGALIRRAFDDGYERYGRRFAVGDAATENRLQAQIIALQQTVINVLQDALCENRQLTRADMARLVAASDAAREGSLDALHQQRRRLTTDNVAAIEGPPPQRRPRSFSPPPLSSVGVGVGVGGGTGRRRSRTLAPLPLPELEPQPQQRRHHHQHQHHPPYPESDILSTTSTTTTIDNNDAVAPAPADDNDGLFCPYSIDLQRPLHHHHQPAMPLASSFAPGGDRRCPACNARLAAAAPDDVWAITKRVAGEPIVVVGQEGRRQKEVVMADEEREFRLGQRFLVKCHTPSGEYACVICRRHRAADAICRSVEALVHHVGRVHGVAELEGEVDLEEVGAVREREEEERAAQRALPPPPPVPMPPSLPPPPPSVSRAAATVGGRSRDGEWGRERGREREREREREFEMDEKKKADEDRLDFRDGRYYALPAKYR